MGKVIERIALERGHEIVLKKNQKTTFEGLFVLMLLSTLVFQIAQLKIFLNV